MKNVILLIILAVTMFLLSCMKDENSDSNEPISIETITIGSQVWMKENLDVDHYRNGDPIPKVKDSAEWVNLKTGAWSYYYYAYPCGKFYNWYAVNDPRGLAPVGYHLPSDAEWTLLTDYLGGEKVAGSKMKYQLFCMNWKYSLNTVSNNSSGLTGLAGGYRSETGEFHEEGFNLFVA